MIVVRKADAGHTKVVSLVASLSGCIDYAKPLCSTMERSGREQVQKVVLYNETTSASAPSDPLLVPGARHTENWAYLLAKKTISTTLM